MASHRAHCALNRAESDPAVHRILAELLMEQDDPSRLDALIAAIRPTVADRVAAEFKAMKREQANAAPQP